MYSNFLIFIIQAFKTTLENKRENGSFHIKGSLPVLENPTPGHRSSRSHEGWEWAAPPSCTSGALCTCLGLGCLPFTHRASRLHAPAQAVLPTGLTSPSFPESRPFSQACHLPHNVLCPEQRAVEKGRDPRAWACIPPHLVCARVPFCRRGTGSVPVSQGERKLGQLSVCQAPHTDSGNSSANQHPRSSWSPHPQGTGGTLGPRAPVRVLEVEVPG